MSLDTAQKIIPREQIASLADRLHRQNKVIVFTNGCFDLLHAGHVTYLEWARNHGDVLIVGLNSDDSVRRLKGSGRPLNPQQDRARVLAALQAVDYVTIFDEDEPADLIAEILPQVLVKGADWGHYISGRNIVEQHGGRVLLAPLLEGHSTSLLIQKIKQQAPENRHA